MAGTPPLPDWQEIRRRLEILFPEGTDNRGYVTRDIAAKTVFVLLYLDAIEGREVWMRPDQVARMTDAQASRTDREERRGWAAASTRPARGGSPDAWYAKNTREPIRDETLRFGFIPLGAVVERQGLPTTSPRGRYALRADFAALFHPALADQRFASAADAWREANLKSGALARVALLRQSTVETGEGILARFPNGETRRLTSGPSSVIARAVVEEFAPRFLERPGVLWLSESARKADQRDAALAKQLRLEIQPDRALPDLILVDLGRGEPLFVFVEVVVSDGAVHEDRRQVFADLLAKGGYTEESGAFVTAYRDRGDPAFRKTFSSLAQRSFAWCLSEPDQLIGLHLHRGHLKLRQLLGV